MITTPTWFGEKAKGGEKKRVTFESFIYMFNCSLRGLTSNPLKKNSLPHTIEWFILPCVAAITFFNRLHNDCKKSRTKESFFNFAQRLLIEGCATTIGRLYDIFCKLRIIKYKMSDKIRSWQLSKKMEKYSWVYVC